MANSFEVTGGLELSGELVPQGAKNEALQILCAVLLTPEKMFTFHAKNINIDYLDTPDFKKQASALRGSIMIVGPPLARYGKARIPNRVVIRSAEEDSILILSAFNR